VKAERECKPLSSLPTKHHDDHNCYTKSVFFIVFEYIRYGGHDEPADAPLGSGTYKLI